MIVHYCNHIEIEFLIIEHTHTLKDIQLQEFMPCCYFKSYNTNILSRIFWLNEQ